MSFQQFQIAIDGIKLNGHLIYLAAYPVPHGSLVALILSQIRIVGIGRNSAAVQHILQPLRHRRLFRFQNLIYVLLRGAFHAFLLAYFLGALIPGLAVCLYAVFF